MENYPGNAKYSRPENKPEPRSAPRIDKVVTNPVVRQKKSLGRRFKDTFIGGPDAQSVWSYVLFDVLIPAGRDMMYDAVTQGFERTLYGDASPRNSRKGIGGAGPFGSIVNYNRASQVPSSRLVAPVGRDPRPQPRVAPRNESELSDFVISTKAEADDVLNRLGYALERYGQVTVGDLYDALGIDSPYTNENWGWIDIRGARVARARHGGYVLSMPAPEPLS